MSKGIHKCQFFDTVWPMWPRATVAKGYGIVVLATLGCASLFRPAYTLAIPRAALSSSYSLWLHWCNSAASTASRHKPKNASAPSQKHSRAKALDPSATHTVCKQLPTRRLTRVVSEQLDLQHMWIASSTELFLELLYRKAHLVGKAVLDQSRGIAARLVQKMHSLWLGCQIVEIALTAHREIVHTDSFHRCWQGHRASWLVGVGIVEPTLYPDSG